MDFNDKRHILQLIDKHTGLFSEIQNMTVRELREYAKKKGLSDLFILVAIPLSVSILSNDRPGKVLKHLTQQKTSKEAKIMEYNLTADDLETLKLMRKGHTNQEIADELDMSISMNGVAKRVSKILRKLNVPNRRKAVAKAIQEGLI